MDIFAGGCDFILLYIKIFVSHSLGNIVLNSSDVITGQDFRLGENTKTETI